MQVGKGRPGVAGWLSVPRALGIMGLIAIVVAVIALVGGGDDPQRSCELVVATNGSDANPGTAAQPLRDPKLAVGAAAPGQTICFRSGTHTWAGALSVRTPGTTITSYPGERATLQGLLRVERPASDTVIEDLLLDGSNPDDYFNPLIYADRTILRGNEITNHHTTNCVHLATYYDEPAPADVIIEDNNIHDCGTLPAQNHEHGIYIGAARNAIIRNNRIWSNADRGIQLFTDVQGTQIYGNVIAGNGQGVLIAGYDGVAPNNTTVEHNIIAHSKVRLNVESSFDDVTTPGTGNVFRENCIYGAEGAYRQSDGSGIQSEQVGFTATGNVIADPGFANPAAGDFTVAADSGCAGVLDGVFS